MACCGRLRRDDCANGDHASENQLEVLVPPNTSRLQVGSAKAESKGGLASIERGRGGALALARSTARKSQRVTLTLAKRTRLTPNRTTQAENRSRTSCNRTLSLPVTSSSSSSKKPGAARFQIGESQGPGNSDHKAVPAVEHNSRPRAKVRARARARTRGETSSKHAVRLLVLDVRTDSNKHTCDRVNRITVGQNNDGQPTT